MAVDGSGRVRLLGSVQLLHPEQQTFDELLDGWRNQQLSRNLKFDTIDQRIRYVRRFVDHVNEFPWQWTPAQVEEYFGDMRSIRHLSHSTLRAHQSALRHFRTCRHNQNASTSPGQIFLAGALQFRTIARHT